MKAYLEFGERIVNFIVRDMTEQNIKTIPEAWQESIIDNYKLCHLFEVDPITKKLLILTKTPKCKASDKMPFYRMFIDVNFSYDELKKLGVDVDYNINGILVIDQFMYTDKRYKKKIMQPHEADSEAIMFYAMLEKNNRIKFDPFIIPVKEMDWMKKFKPRKKEHKFIVDFFRNMLHLMNDPHVKTIKIDRDEGRNQKREKKGKLPIPERNIIKVTGILKEYINRLESDSKIWSYNYAFWVRGHFKHWQSDCYKKMQGKRTWVPPFIKGKGILIKKNYNLDVKI